MTSSSRVHYLDGLRGILAIVVFIHHLLYAFWPEVIFGGTSAEFLDTSTFNLKRVFALTPLNIFFNPGMAILFFFLLSGYVQTKPYFDTNNISFLQKSFVKRHFRLAIPTVSVVVLVFAFHRLHFIHNDLFPPNNLSDKWAQSLLPDKLGLPGVLYHGFVECFVTSSRYYQILWTMPVELINSFIVLVLPIASHNLKNKAWLFVAWLMVQLFLLQSYNGAAFTFGLLFAYWLKSGAQFVGFFSHKAVRLVCWLLGLYFASYPYTGYQNSVFTSIYKTISFFEVYPNIISYLVGVVLLFLALYFSPRIRNMLSYRIFIFFGKISFMFYLVHFLLLFSFSPYLYQALLPFVPHQMNMLITGLLSFALISGVSYLLYKFVDRPVIELCNLYSKKFFGR